MTRATVRGFPTEITTRRKNLAEEPTAKRHSRGNLIAAGQRQAVKTWRAAVKVWGARVVWEIEVGLVTRAVLVKVDWEIEVVG
jgi:hypothetical protein